MLKSLVKLLILVSFLNALNSTAQNDKENTQFKLGAIGMQYNNNLSWHFVPRYTDFNLLSNSLDSGMYLNQYGYNYTDINRSEETYFSLYAKFFKSVESNKSIKHSLLFGISVTDLSSDNVYLYNRSEPTTIDSSIIGQYLITLDKTIASKYFFRYYSQKIAVNLGYAYQFEVNDFLELSFGLNTDFLVETSSSLSLTRILDVEYISYYNDLYAAKKYRKPFNGDYHSLHKYEKDYTLLNGLYLRPWVPVAINCKLLGFDNDTKWLMVTLQGGIGYQFAMVKDVKIKGSEFYSYGVGLQYRF
ncbi:MAG: hypothetical protein HOD63_12810 [Bacteroidetes bacterium]|nr:hypothetical protein [Bacteroidota bacterium]MBT4339467.1 hypothetical protein [Bacteroidota bacterium]